MNENTVYVVLLNWNGWRDTVACLDSLLASQGVHLRAIVCDNDSGDGSLEHIEDWANGLLTVDGPDHPRLSSLLQSAPQPLAHIRIDRATAEYGDCAPAVPLVLIENGANLGFAAGNNVGLRYALRQSDMSHVWVLNNDTLVERDCLQRMLRRLQRQNGPAVCGSMIHFFDQPEILQAIGGNRFNRMTGSAACSEGRFVHEDSLPDIAAIEQRLSYISGCSLLLPREFLETVGLMGEDYFLYYEEIDWFTRAAGRFAICVAADARVYHREGASIGSKSLHSQASTLSEFHMYRSRMIYMRKHQAASLALCYARSWIEVVKKVLLGQFRNALTVATVLLGRKSFAS